MEKMEWKGNMTVKMDGKEDTYSPEFIELEEYSKDSFSLRFAGGGGRSVVTVRLGRKEYKELIERLVRLL